MLIAVVPLVSPEFSHIFLITLMSLFFLFSPLGLRFVFQTCFKFFLQLEAAWSRLIAHVLLCLPFSFSSFSWALPETHGFCLLPVNSFGDDEEPCTSSDTDEEVIRQFEISVSRSQSFRSRTSERGKQMGWEQKPKFRHLLSTREERSAEVSACEGILCTKPFL